MNQLVLEHADLPLRVARKWFPKTDCPADRDDLVSEATLGLIDAAQRFRPRKGAFKTYAKRRISGAIQDYLRSLDPLSRDMRGYRTQVAETFERLRRENCRDPSTEEMARAMGMTVEEYADLRLKCRKPEFIEFDSPAGGEQLSERLPHPGPSVESVVIARLDAQEAMGVLDERLRYVVEQRFFGGRNLAEIGGDFDLSEARACQLVAQAVREMGEEAGVQVSKSTAKRTSRSAKAPRPAA